MIFLGIGETISGLTMGRFIDKFGSRWACYLNLLVLLATILVSIVNIKHAEYGYMSYITCFFWGFQDGIVATHCFQILGYEFDTQSDPFGVFEIGQGVSICFFQFL